MDSTEGSDVMQADIETEENSISVTQEGDYKQMYNTSVIVSLQR